MSADEHTQRAAIAHEGEHIAARDPQLMLGALILVVLAPWNLPLWWQWQRLRFAIEVDCDERVLLSGQEAAQYGAALLNVAERRSAVPWMSPAMNDSTCALARRIRLLFADRPSWPKSMAAALSLSALALTVAAAQIVPPAVPGETPVSTAADPVRGSRGHELINAVHHGDFDAAAALIDAGADVNYAVPGDGTPMIIAARRGNLRLVRLLLQKGALPNLASPGDGSPLIMASAHGHKEVVVALVERGADVNGIVIGDETPLINAARGGYLQLVEYLVERGADVSLAVPADRSFLAEIRSP